MDEPVAIIGLDARFPGDGDTAERFYELLLAGRSARTEVPRDRYNAEVLWHPDPERAGSTRAKSGHFLKGSVSAFDAPFFSITPSEASFMDPQQRGMLESVYNALENAGISLSEAAGTQTGVYVGCFSSDYSGMMAKDLDVSLKHAGSGTIASMLSNRVSWFFDLRGPSLTIDTACSSSLVAVHEACVNLKQGEISMAVVGGCNLVLSPELTLKLDAAGVLGPDGKSYSFDHRANGYSRGEGFGVVVLKRVSDAIRDGDVIRAIIRNSSANQDGKSPGITQPTKAAQVQLMKTVYSKASLNPSLTRFFEAHGTGTVVGDSIEASAISEVFTPHRSSDQPLYVGALKSNVGHLEGAAGIASLIKGVYTLERGIIPANAWFEKPNHKIHNSWHLKFPTEATAWPQPGLRRMSINSFGIGGSNAHVVLDDALHFLKHHHLVGNHRTMFTPELRRSPTVSEKNGYTDGIQSTLPTEKYGINGARLALSEDRQIYVFSSFDQDGVSRLHKLYKGYLDSTERKTLLVEGEQRLLKDLSYTLAAKRTHHSWRSYIVAQSRTALQEALDKDLVPIHTVEQPRLAFVFTGQGAQWATMGRELMVYSTFQQSLFNAGKYLNDLGCLWSLPYELCKDFNSKIDDPEFSQPICTALQVAIVDLLKTWNIYPHAVVGHSSGEIGAAYAAGAISKEAAWRISYYRGKLCASLSRSPTNPKTGMAAVALEKDDTIATIKRVNVKLGGVGSLEIACMNSPRSHTVSGDIAKIDTVVEILTSEKIFARKLSVEIAYHSQYMNPIREQYLEAIGEIEKGIEESQHKPRFFSSTLGTMTTTSSLQSPAYWVNNLSSPVRFSESVTQMLAEPTGEQQVKDIKFGNRSFRHITDILEIGPHSALKGPLRSIFEQVEGGSAIRYFSMLKRHETALETALSTAASLFCHGYEVNLLEVNKTTGTRDYSPLMLTDLPRYPFNHSKEYWAESRLSRASRFPRAVRHELLGAPVPDWNQSNAVWRNWIRVSENPWLEDHRVSGDILYPAAGMLVMAIEASRQIADPDQVLKGFNFKEVFFHQALRLPVESQGLESQFYLRPLRENTSSSSSWNEFQLFTHGNNEWREHCNGLVQIVYGSRATSVDGGLEDELFSLMCEHDLKRAQEICSNKVPVKNVYRTFRDTGLEFGETFQTLREISLGPALLSLAQVNAPTERLRKSACEGYLHPHLVHPTTLDGLLQANILPLIRGSNYSRPPVIPSYFDELWISAEATAVHDSYRVSAHAEFRGRQEALSSFIAIEPETGRPMVTANGLVFKSIPGNPSQSSQNVPKNSAFNIAWKPDPTFLNLHSGSKVFGVPEMKKIDPSDYRNDCEALCLLYMRQSLESYAENINNITSAHHQRYISWMEQVTSNHKERVTENDIADLESKVRERNTPEGKLAIAVGRALPAILGGLIDPLEVLFGDQLVENVYRNGLNAERCYAQLRKYIDALVHKNPAMEILEIGAGTGGATIPIMETLSREGQRYKQYHFTDISPSFFEQAKVLLEDQLGRISFQVLNIEESPQGQGFKAGRYDLVIAANVLHATKNIDVALKNAHLLLRPGGKLLLYEITDPFDVFSQFIFGLLPGWWLSEDADRESGPLMSIENWMKHLKGSGFTGLDVILHDFPDPEHQTSSILVSTKLLPEPRQIAQATATTSILTHNASTLQTQVAGQLSNHLSQAGITYVTAITEVREPGLVGGICIVLAELDSPVLVQLSEEELAAVQRIVKHCKTLIWLTRGGDSIVTAPEMDLITGLARCVRTENTDLNFVTVSFSQNEGPGTIVHKTTQILNKVKTQDEMDNSFRVFEGVVHIPRLVEAEYLTRHIESQTASRDVVEGEFAAELNKPLTLSIGTTGMLDTLRFEDDDEQQTLGDYEVEVKPAACGMNFHDLAILLGKVEETPLGLEAAGTVTKVGTAARFKAGDRVFGLFFDGSIKSLIRTHEGFLAKVPTSMSWVEAASIPIVYTTAYATLHETGSLNAGDTILIHSAAGGLGQAAIQIAQRQGAEIFVTVGTIEKREFLGKVYNIPQDHIFSSHDLSFRTYIKHMTCGRGVDVVLNSLSGEALRASWDCVAPFGRFVELGMSDIHSNSRITMKNFNRNTRLESFDLIFLARQDPARAHLIFQRTVDLVLHTLDVKSRLTPITVFSFSQIQDAFRHMQSGKHIGKLVLEPHDNDVVSVLPSPKPACQFDPEASYVISGGLGGLGSSIARWMVTQGVKNLILLSRSGAVEKQAKDLITELQSVCDNVVAPPCDVADAEKLQRTISLCLTYMPPIRGCIQGSMVLKDNIFENMSLDEWNGAIRPKVDASWNLCNILGHDLDFFIMLSSTAGISGSREQSNYAAGNTFQDALARYWVHTQRTHAVSLNLPVVLDVGFVAEKPELLDDMCSTGWSYMTEKELHSVLDYHCRPVAEPISLIHAQVAPRMWLPQDSADEGAQIPPWQHDPLLNHLSQTKINASETTMARDVKYAILLAGTVSLLDAENVVLDALLSKLSRILSTELSSLDSAKPLHAYGIDSLVAVELRSWFFKELGAELSVFEMTDKSSIYQLAQAATLRSRFLPAFEVEVNGST